jgi:phage-related protein
MALYEIRVEHSGNIFRVFSFFDKGKLIITINGFHKKSPKTPKKEITKVLKIKQEYFNEK